MNDQSLAPHKKALQSLKNSIKQPIDEFVRDSVIQRFEFTFELSWKNLKRYLETDKPLQDDSVKGVLREAHSRKLISDIEKWFEFHKARNLTSHTYNEDTAEEVYEIAKKFPKYCEELITNLEVKIAK